MGSEVVIEAEGLCDTENTIFVAVGNNVIESKSTLLCVLESFVGRKICILHVHQPAHFDIATHCRKLKQDAVKACREVELEKMHKLLNHYLLVIAQEQVQAGKVWIENENIEKGIVQIIVQNGIRWLVMGAAEKHYSRKMSADLMSEKALSVCKNAPASCHIWFASKGCLIYTRERYMNLSSQVRSAEEELKQLSDHATDAHDVKKRCQGQTSNNLNDKVEEAMIDAENSNRKAFEESVTRWKAEEDAFEALRMAEASQNLWMKEVNERKDREELLKRQSEEIEKMKDEHQQCIKQLQMVEDQMLVLNTQIKESNHVEKELEEKIIQAVELLISFKKKRDELLTDLEKAKTQIYQLRKLENTKTSLCDPQFTEYSFLEIVEGTQNFDPSWKVGEGKCGSSVYKGILRHLKVAIKMLPCNGSRGISEFEHQAKFLSRVRHANLVNLIGTCPDSRSLVYEYLENGNLEDCLSRNYPPLSWQTRVKCVIEICSAFIFLHSNNPPIVHGNLKLTNVLLDANFVTKLTDFGIYRSTNNNNNDPLDSSWYVDPESLETGELTIESDIYSFGMVLLRMLTGRPALSVVNDVKHAIENGKFDVILDISAGDWPFEQAKQLVNMALRCCDQKRLNRPALVPDIWSLIEPLRALCSTSGMKLEGIRKIPSHFVCPIFQELMEDPYIAADGFTYEGDAIKGWLNSGHKTSPMTNLKLDHCDLLPNYAIFYAIQEWLRHQH